MVDKKNPITAKFKRGGRLYQGDALRHIPEGGWLPHGQRSITDQPVTTEEVDEAHEAYASAKAASKARAQAKAKSSPEPPGPPPQQERRCRNQRTYDQWQQ